MDDSTKLDKIISMLETINIKIDELEYKNHLITEKINRLEENTEKIDKDTKDILEGTGRMTDHLNIVNTIYDNVRKPITNITKMFLGKDNELLLPDRKSIEYKNDAKIEDITDRDD